MANEFAKIELPDGAVSSAGELRIVLSALTEQTAYVTVQFGDFVVTTQKLVPAGLFNGKGELVSEDMIKLWLNSVMARALGKLFQY